MTDDNFRELHNHLDLITITNPNTNTITNTITKEGDFVLSVFRSRTKNVCTYGNQRSYWYSEMSVKEFIRRLKELKPQLTKEKWHQEIEKLAGDDLQ